MHHGRVVKRTGDGALVEFRSVVDAVRCAIEVQTGLVERNAGLPPERKIEFRIGIHLGDVMEEADGDLMGDGVNIAARLEDDVRAGRRSPVRGRLSPGQRRLDLAVTDLGDQSAQEHRRAGAGLCPHRRQAGDGASGAAEYPSPPISLPSPAGEAAGEIARALVTPSLARAGENSPFISSPSPR